MPLIAEFDEFAVVGLLHVIGAHHFKYVAEQVELPVWVRGGRFRACSDEDAVWLRRQECEPGTCDRAQENEGDFAYHPRTFHRRLLPTKGGWDQWENRLAELIRSLRLRIPAIRRYGVHQ